MHKEWPLGKLPRELQRPELNLLRDAGYDFKDPNEVIEMFENKVAEFAGSKYAVAVDSCSNALFLCMKYLECQGTITIPKQTYISVPMQIKHAGCDVAFRDEEWKYMYQLAPYPIYDAAAYWGEGMFSKFAHSILPGSLQCVSFQIKKTIPIGKGGMILTNDLGAATWLRVARHDGRTAGDYPHMIFKVLGYHMNMTPEDAARGILLMDSPHKMVGDPPSFNNYTDISHFEIFK